MSKTHMDPALVERIVQEVIRRLLDRGVEVIDSTESATPTADLEIEDKVVTLATLRDRLSGVSSLLVGRRAIVTPAVIDDLNDRGIKLTRRDRP